MIIGFSKPKKFNLFSWLIRKYQGKSYSHTFLVAKVPGVDRQVVFHATHIGVNCISYEAFHNHAEVVTEVNIPDDNLIDALTYCIDKLGSPYSFYALIAIALKLKLNGGEKKFICSELVGRALKLDIKDYDRVTPEEIETILKAKYAKN